MNKKAEERRRKKFVRSWEYWMKNTVESGPGFEADVVLRQFFQEYNNRLFQLGPKQMPSHFNFLKDFFLLKDQRFYIKEEKDHTLSFLTSLNFVLQMIMTTKCFLKILSKKTLSITIHL